MARKARKEDNCTLLSITQKSAMPLFRDDVDRERMLTILEKAQDKFGYVCYAYCLLDDHVFRLIIDTKGRNISTIMQSIFVAYSRYRNVEGKLFTGRFLSKSLHNTSALSDEIDAIQKKTNSQFNSFCFHCQEAKRPSQFSVALDPQNLQISEMDSMLSLEEAKSRLESWMNIKGCDPVSVKKDKMLRNQCILEFRRTSNASLKTLGLLFSISESSVSKILKNSEHPV
jgi:hypothetical protein